MGTWLLVEPRAGDRVDIRETVETGRGAISADVRGYALPHTNARHLHVVQGLRTLPDRDPEYAAYNHAVVAIEGTVDMATGEIDVERRAFGAERTHQRLDELALAA